MGFLSYFSKLNNRIKQDRLHKLNNKLILKDMPYLYNLITIATSSGLNPQASLECISDFVPSSFGEDIDNAIHSISSGKSFRQSLETWNENEQLRPLAHIMAESMESGSSALPALDALSKDALTKVHRRCDVAIKQLPVTMLFPLVVCILPAFMLLSVVPTLIHGFASFNW